MVGQLQELRAAAQAVHAALQPPLLFHAAMWLHVGGCWHQPRHLFACASVVVLFMLLLHACDHLQVGAGTMNPATFLRVLGPEPWNVAYAEPSIRPDDSRYGDNPNRVQRHTQFQVGVLLVR